MAHEVSAVDSFPLRRDDSIIDFAFISEENFLLIVFLTAQADLIILYKTGSTMRIEHSSVNKFYALSRRGANSFMIVSLTADASVIALALSNMDIILLPLRYLMPTTWGRSNVLVQKPTKFSYDFSQLPSSTNGGESVPTSMFCFNSRKSETFLVIGDTFGNISVIDLGQRTLSVRLNCAEGICELSSFVNPNGLYAMVMTRSRSYFVVPLELRGKSVRETLALVVPSQLSDISEVHRYDYLPLNSRSSNRAAKVAVIQQDTHTMTIKNCLFDDTGTASCGMPNNIKNLRKLQCTTKTFFAAGKAEVFVAYHFLPTLESSSAISFDKVQLLPEATLGQRLLGLIPCCQKNESELEECLIILSSGAYWIQPNKPIYYVIADYVVKSKFQSQLFLKLADNLQQPPGVIYEKALEIALADSFKDEDLDGFISLGFEIDHPTNKIVELLSRRNHVHLLLPFLQLRCEKDPSDGPTRQFLFNAYISKLTQLDHDNADSNSQSGGLNGQVNNNCDMSSYTWALRLQRDEIEEEIRQFLIRHIASTANVKVLTILLKHSLWRCVAAMLAAVAGETPPQTVLAATIARHLAELTSWRDQLGRPGFLKCLTLVEWPTGESMGQVIVSKMILSLPSLSTADQFQIFYNIANAMLKRSLGFAMTLFLVSAICLLECITATDECYDGNENGQRRLSCGSNCAAAIVDSSGVNFWGEFAAGALRLSNEARQRVALGGTRRDVNSSRQSMAGNSTPKSRCVTAPKIVALPVGSSCKIKSVACGTEHILLLTVDGRILSWGRNTYGQCGNGNRQRVTQPTMLDDVSYGRAVKIFAGHYHSALINEIGEMWLWGWGMYGQLATGDNVNCYIPTRTNLIRSVSDISLGYAHSLFLLHDGTVWGCGATANGQLGRDFSKIFNKNREVSISPSNNNSPRWGITNVDVKAFDVMKVKLPSPARLLSSRYFHGVAICEQKSLQSWRHASAPPSAEARRSPTYRESSVPSPDPKSPAENLRCDSSTTSVIVEWGECPQTIRMRTFLLKQLHGKQKSKTVDGRKSSSTLSRALANRFRPSKRLYDKSESQTGDVVECDDSESLSDFPAPKAASSAMEAPTFDHFRVRRCCEWRGSRIRQLSAGFNHSAFVTERGELYTWGRALEMQLGHDDKKDREVPTRVHLPDRRPIKWEHVECARNYTMALCSEGNVYVWGRNDRSQLGLGNCKITAATNTKVRRIALKPKSGAANMTKYIELPSNAMNVGKPTRLLGLEVSMDRVLSPAEIVEKISDKMKCADQSALNNSSRFFAKNPVSERLHENLRRSITINNTTVNTPKLFSFAIVFAISNIHVSSGELLRTVDALIGTTRLMNEHRIYESVVTATTAQDFETSNNKIVNNHRKGSVINQNYLANTGKTNSRKHEDNKAKETNSNRLREDVEKTSDLNVGKNTLDQIDKKDNGKLIGNGDLKVSNIEMNNDDAARPNSPNRHSTSVDLLKEFDAVVDRIWNLIRAHPQRDIQVVALLTMLRERFPIYHRLSADTRLCRLIDPYVSELLPEILVTMNRSGSTSNRPVFSNSSSRYKLSKFSEFTIHERRTFLGNAKLVVYLKSSTQHARLRALRQRCEAESIMNRFRFYSNCGHYERCVIESGASKQKISTFRNRLRKCSQCVVRSRYASILPNDIPTLRTVHLANK